MTDSMVETHVDAGQPLPGSSGPASRWILSYKYKKQVGSYIRAAEKAALTVGPLGAACRRAQARSTQMVNVMSSTRVRTWILMFKE
jgi:hypothetical protein